MMSHFFEASKVPSITLKLFRMFISVSPLTTIPFVVSPVSKVASSLNTASDNLTYLYTSAVVMSVIAIVTGSTGVPLTAVGAYKGIIWVIF